MGNQDRPLAGIVLRIGSGLLFAAMLICVKWVSDDVPLGQVVFFRSAFALLPIVVFLAWRHEFPKGLATRRPGGHLLRSSLGAASMFATFAALARLPVAEATLLAQLAPVLMAIGGVVMLGERFTLPRALALMLAVAGVAVLVVPDIGDSHKAGQLSGYALGVLGASLTAAALVTVRRISRTEGAGAIAFYFVLACTLAGLATWPLGWVALPTETLTLLILSGLFGGAAHICMTLALRFAEVSRLAPFEYIALIWPVLADVWLFGQPLSSGFLLALPLMLGGAALAAMEGRRLGFRRRRPDTLK
ncbi:DMT family transporter [Halomonas denitrificans]|uniref:DMT family transporter n=1 Tax=Halomonas TaxID=2745 RepID=UPI001A905D30|nr:MULTISPECIES: DMT family transporter [Halomonas]MED5297462.1 DMT family transporter [Pseudomonadota bacterium]MBN8413020.1 DMT family transporter [Halomonas litopenaei]MBY5929144.1 DMT family transporter [Halomonas sp. DP8Y7-3]MBY5968223.1 DMT family transporter [Halomonas denitrificans]MBY6031415.1 DMT family transporter [Halomonas sp. DP8Y7-1]